jgi:Uma2 family endonuclease
MSPQNYRRHEPLVRALNLALCGLAQELDLGRYFLPPSWLSHKPCDLSTEPDGFFALWSTLESGELCVNPEREVEMLGRPDMVLEVVSDSSRRKDLVDHVADYAQTGVREYWIADARTDIVELRILTLGQGAYADVQAVDGWIPSPLWRRSFRVRELPARAGLPDFRLDIR